MTKPILAACLVLLASFVPLARAADPALPRLEKRGQATQLVVDGHPYLILGGELHNTASSDLPYMKEVWPQLTRMNLNTALVAVSWSWIEPEEGKFDFSLVDQLLAGARENHLRVVLLWFGSWKNGLSSFAPAWVKADQARFPRVKLRSGPSLEILSPLDEQVRSADTRAYVALVRHLAETDPQRTVLMLQMQNEVGVLGDTRDHSDVANAAFAAAVPAELMRYLSAHRATLSPQLRELWQAAGEKTSDAWTDVFGRTPATDEIFMAWAYARAMDAMSAAGKAIYPLPVFTNTWIVQPEDKVPGDYPSGGPQPLTLDIWKAGAPSIDFNAPDIYLPDFPARVGPFHRPDNPIFVPESFGDALGVANAFYCIGAHASLGYSPFGIDTLAAGAPPESLPLARAYATLRDLAPLILEHQTRGSITAAWLSKTAPHQPVVAGDHTLQVTIRKERRSGALAGEIGYALILTLGPDEFLIAGQDVQITFAPRTPGAPIDGIADAETGRVREGRWQPGRKMNGDDVMIDYRLDRAAAAQQSGSGLVFGPDGPTLQRIKLYRYR